MATRIQLRRGTALQWATANTLLSQGEMGIEIDTNKIKIGNGTTPWNSLPYYQTNTDLALYATKQYVDTAISNINIPDVSNFITAAELVDYSTKQYVDTAISNINIPDVSNFITAEDLPANELPLNATGYLFNSGNGTLSWDNDVTPTALSQLANDVGFITLGDVPEPFSKDYNELTNKPQIPALGSWQFEDNVLKNNDSVTAIIESSQFTGAGIAIQTRTSVDSKTWEFKQDGNLQLPPDGDIIDSAGNSVLGGSSVSTIQPYLELSNDPFIWEPYATGVVITFTKEDYATGAAARDEIDPGLALTSLDQQGLFNPYLEPDWDNTSSDGPSPAGTLWNKEGWGDLTNLNQRTYFSFYDTFLRFGNNVIDAEAVMKDVANNKYYKFDFTVWGNANIGAPVSYTRTQIDPVTGIPIGDPVTFEKSGYADPTTVNDPIDANLTIARGNQQSIYNIVLETSYNTQGDGEDSPEGTLWNSNGWDNFKEVRNRSYVPLQEALNYNIDANIVGTELVMHDTINDKYWAVKFSSWTPNAGGGGFSYTRQQINTRNLFVKPDNTNSIVDTFVEDDGNGAGIGITRGYDGAIYNPYRESSWNDNVSPDGTLWNIEGWDDLSNITTRTYQTFYNAFGRGGLGNKIPGTKSIMYIPETEKYYAIQWLSWTQSGGGGFSYVRYELDVTKVSEGVKFADGTVLKSAEGVGRVKSTASNNRRIEEVVGNKTVSVTSRITQPAVQGTSFDSRTDYYLYLVWNQDLYNLYNGPSNFKIEFSLDNTSWYPARVVGANNGTWLQIYLEGDRQLTVNTGDPMYYRVITGADPVIWWDKNDLPGGSANFRGAVIDYHAYTGESTIIGTIHIVDDSGEEHISHQEVQSGSTAGENDDLWVVQNEGTISYRRIDGEAKTLKVHWTAKVFYGSEFYD
jgi:hypothetical protein